MKDGKPWLVDRECDPSDVDPHTPGAKLDQDKILLGLVLMDFAPALIEVGKVGTFGARKYTEHGWLTVPNGEKRYTDALFRHLFAEGAGEEYDQESELLHASQTAWNSLARLVFILRRKNKTVALNTEESCPST